MDDLTQNPVLHEINSLSPSAQAALLSAHQQASVAPMQSTAPANVEAENAPPPSLIQHPDAQSPAPAPLTRGTVEGDRAEQTRLLKTGSGISQIGGKIEGAMPNHPFLGKLLGGAAQGLATIGDVGLRAVAPAVDAAIPGTSLHHVADVHTNQRQIAQDEDNDEKQARTLFSGANTAKTNVETGALPEQNQDKHDLSQAEIGNYNSEAESRAHPQPKSPLELALRDNPHLTAVDWDKMQQHPISADEAKALNGTWNPLSSKHGLPADQFKEGMSRADATALSSSLNNVVGKQQGDTKVIIAGQSAANAGNKSRDAETEKEYMAAQKDLGAQFAKATAQAQALSDARTEIGSGAIGQALGTIKSLVGLAGGQGSGVRITQAELNSIANARGLSGGFDGFLNSIEGKGKLSDRQVSQLNGLLSGVESKLQEKMGKQDTYLDKLSGAASPQEIRQIQSEYRKDLLNGGAPKEGDTKKNSHGDDVVFRGGKWGPA